MSNYFSHFPKVSYDIDKTGNTQEVVDILRRFVVHTKLQNKTAVYYTYDIQEHDTAWSIASKYYGDSKYDWVVLLSNNIFDAFYGWPLSYQEFINFIESKYGDIPTAKTQIHHYERIVKAEFNNSKGKRIPEVVVEIDLTTYNTLLVANKRIVYAYDYEQTVNESRRSIKILDKQYLGIIVKEAEGILKR